MECVGKSYSVRNWENLLCLLDICLMRGRKETRGWTFWDEMPTACPRLCGRWNVNWQMVCNLYRRRTLKATNSSFFRNYCTSFVQTGICTYCMASIIVYLYITNISSSTINKINKFLERHNLKLDIIIVYITKTNRLLYYSFFGTSCPGWHKQTDAFGRATWSIEMSLPSLQGKLR